MADWQLIQHEGSGNSINGWTVPTLGSEMTDWQTQSMSEEGQRSVDIRPLLFTLWRVNDKKRSQDLIHSYGIPFIWLIGYHMCTIGGINNDGRNDGPGHNLCLMEIIDCRRKKKTWQIINFDVAHENKLIFPAERERQRERKRDRDRGTKRDRERERQRDWETVRQRQRQRQNQS